MPSTVQTSTRLLISVLLTFATVASAGDVQRGQVFADGNDTHVVEVREFDNWQGEQRARTRYRLESAEP